MLEQDPPPPRRVDPAIPRDLETIVLKATAKESSQRYPTVQEMADDLKRFLADEPIHARRASLANRAAKWTRRHRTLTAAALAVLATLVILVVAEIVRWQQQQVALAAAVQEDVAQATEAIAADRWPEAGRALAQAEVRVADGGPAWLIEEVGQYRRGIEMANRLEDAKAEWMYPEVSRAFGRASSWYGLKVDSADPDVIAREIRASPIRMALIIALDDWAGIRDALKAGSGESLRDLVERADTDSWRSGVRDVWRRKNFQALEQLSTAEALLEQPPANLRLLAMYLYWQRSTWAAEETLLRRAQQVGPPRYDGFAKRVWNGSRLTANGKCRLEHGRRTMGRLLGNSGISAFPPLCQCYRGIHAACSLWAVTILFLAGAAAWAEPVKVWPVNPRYMMSQGKPIVLVTSDHHYGAVLDRDFDFAKFLAYLGRSSMNLTRIYPGGMFEPTDKYVRGNPIGPEFGRQILPWARSNQAGAHPQLAMPGQPSLKYDLDRWDDEYFARLRGFVETAQTHNVIVEVAFFNGMYADCWPLMALYHGNNIQGVGTYEPELCWLFTSADPRNADVLERQKAYVRKIVVELNAYDNLIYDICDEPNWSGDTVKAPSPDVAIPWLRALAETVVEAEKELPKKHLLGQTVQSASPDLSADAWCDWLPTEYITAARAAFEKNYGANKPLVNVESDYYGHGLVKPYTVDDIRIEGWWFMVGGGAGCINLNGEYHRGQETGGPDTQRRIVPQKKVLKDFIESLDLAGLRRFTDLSGVPAGAIASAVAEPGKQYALYLFHGRDDGNWGAHFMLSPGAYEDAITMKEVPAGDYVLEWVDPTTGTTKQTEAKTHGGGDLALKTPPYAVDVALRMRRKAAPGN